MFDYSGTKLWWEVDDAYKVIWEALGALYDDNYYTRAKNSRHTKQYSGDDFAIANPEYTYSSQTLSTISVFQSILNPPLNVNVSKSCIDTLVAKICKNKVKPMFLTSGGTYKAEKQAKQLNKFINGLFYQTNFYQMATEIKRDEFIFGTGCAYVYEDPETNKVNVERVYPGEICVDMADGMYQKPRAIYRVRSLPRDYLRNMFPEYAEAINRAKAINVFTGRSYSELLMVYDAWHLPCNGIKGRHVFGIETCSFADEEYVKDDFPFIFTRYSSNILGFWGVGVCEELVSIQGELNRLLMNIQEAMRLSANPKVFVEEASGVNPLHLSNDNAIIVKYRNTPPVYAVNPSVHPDQFQMTDFLFKQAYGIVGLSELTASGTKPPGLNSGKAIDSFHDIETERFSHTARLWEDLHIKCAEKMLDMVHDIYERDGTYEVSSFSKKEGMENIDFADIKVDRDGYVMQCFPISDFPSTPSGKLNFIQEMASSGLIDPMMAMELLDFPDTDKMFGLKLAPLRSILQNIEDMLDTQKLISPEPYDNLEMCIQYGNYYYHWARNKKLKDSSLELIRAYISKAAKLLEVPEQAAQTAAAPAPEMGINPELQPTPPMV
jgi:hypothetical protein